MANLSVDEILGEVFGKLATVDEHRFAAGEVGPLLTSLAEAMANPMAHSVAGEIAKLGQKLLQPDVSPESVAVHLDLLDHMMVCLRFALELPVEEDPGEFSEELVERFLSHRDVEGDVVTFSASGLDSSLVAEFISQHQVTLDDIETVVLGMEDGLDEESLRTVRRLTHTLKGDAGLVGMSHIESHTHRLEDELSLEVTDLVDRVLTFVDWVRQRMTELAASDDGGAESADDPATEQGAAEISMPAQYVDLALGDPEMTADFVTESTELLEEVESLLLRLETDRTEKETLNAVFRAFHTIKGLASFLELPHIKDLAHEAESLLDAARSDKLVLEGAPFEATLEAFDLMKTMIADCQAACGGDGKLPGYSQLPALLQRLVAARDGSASPTRTIEQAPSAAGQDSASSNDVAPSSDEPTTASPGEGDLGEPRRVLEASPAAGVPAAPAASSGGAPAAASPRGASGAIQETIRVDPRRLDRLVDAIGELVIAESMVGQALHANHQGTAEVSGLLGHMNKITRELQEMAMSLRMVPLRSTFRRMTRLARDVAKKLGKRIEFQSIGDDAELDKTMVDAIGDPLMHMIRNAVDHGLEGSVQERRAAGKPDVGKITIRAFHEGGGIYIEVSDDGRGLDKEAVLAKAVDRGLVREGESLSDQDILQLILEPGFSTAKAVSEVSGRGVGLDVVKRNIESLRGQVDVRSQQGAGTTFVIQLPLTLAVIEGMVVRVGRQRFVIPTLDIVRIIQPSDEALSSVFDRGDMLNVGGDLMPLFKIQTVLDIDPCQDDEWTGAVVVVSVGGRRAALAVDAIVGQQQIVIKSLGDDIAESRGISGGAIMPDGRVGLILDTNGVVGLAVDSNKELVGSA